MNIGHLVVQCGVVCIPRGVLSFTRSVPDLEVTAGELQPLSGEVAGKKGSRDQSQVLPSRGNFLYMDSEEEFILNQ